VRVRTHYPDFRSGSQIRDRLKTGSTARSDRVAKYNRLLNIEQDLINGYEYLGSSLFKL